MEARARPLLPGAPTPGRTPTPSARSTKRPAAPARKRSHPRAAGEAGSGVLRGQVVPADVAAARPVGPRRRADVLLGGRRRGGSGRSRRGSCKAARTGAAEKIRDYASTVIALDPEFEEGGGYRVLGRLHHQAPRIPFLTAWVSRDEGAREPAPRRRVNDRNFVNRHFLAEALADGDAAERAEAIRIEAELVADAPSPGHLVEDLAIQDEAKKNLATWKK